MIMTRGGPLPTTRYPTAPSAVWAIRTGADTTEAGPVEPGLVEAGPVEAGPVEVVGEEPQAARATDSRAVTSPRPIPRSLVRLHVRVIFPARMILAAEVTATRPVSRLPSTEGNAGWA